MLLSYSEMLVVVDRHTHILAGGDPLIDVAGIKTELAYNLGFSDQQVELIIKRMKKEGLLNA